MLSLTKLLTIGQRERQLEVLQLAQKYLSIVVLTLHQQDLKSQYILNSHCSRTPTEKHTWQSRGGEGKKIKKSNHKNSSVQFKCQREKKKWVIKYRISETIHENKVHNIVKKCHFQSIHEGLQIECKSIKSSHRHTQKERESNYISRQSLYWEEKHCLNPKGKDFPKRIPAWDRA